MLAGGSLEDSLQQGSMEEATARQIIRHDVHDRLGVVLLSKVLFAYRHAFLIVGLCAISLSLSLSFPPLFFLFLCLSLPKAGQSSD